MKIYFKFILAVIFITGSITVNAQDSFVKAGAKVGLNLSLLDGDYNNTDMRVGYMFGLTLDFNLGSEWMIMTGAELTKKGVGLNEFDHDGYIDAVYLQAPFHIGNRLRIANNFAIVPHAGIYVATGLWGDSRTDMDGFKTFDDKLKKEDFGIGIGAGVESQSFFFDFNYHYGLLDVGIPISARNTSFEFTTAYKF